MRGRPNPVEALVALPTVSEGSERLANWRQAIAALGHSVSTSSPPPLDDVNPELLISAVQVALETGLCDELDFVAPGPAAVALYELTAALPHGRERRELGRRVLARVYQGTAATFAAVATRMALSAGRSLEVAAVRARVALVFDMPIPSQVNAGALALALVSRREVFERWILAPATRSLHGRRLAAKLFEHAAREACVRAQQGDPFFSELLRGPSLRSSFEQLLADREPLVWRHAAVARGLLAAGSAELREQIELGLDPDRPPGDWRRSAVSLVAGLVSEPVTGLGVCQGLLDGELASRDPGLPAAMVWGLPRVVEAEPDAAEELLERLAAKARPELAEEIASLVRELSSPSFGSGAASALSAVLADTGDPLRRGIAERARMALERTDESSLCAMLRRSIDAYETQGARPAYELALEALEIARADLARVLEVGQLDTEASDVLARLSDLDEGMLGRSRLSDLLLLGRSPSDSDVGTFDVHELCDSLGRYLLTHEQALVGEPYQPAESIADQRRLRVLLHLVDLNSIHADIENSDERARIRETVKLFTERLCKGPDPEVRQILCAALARSCDAAAREGASEAGDLLLAIASRLDDDRTCLVALADASNHPDVRAVFSAYSEFCSPLLGRRDDIGDPENAALTDYSESELLAVARGVLKLSRGLGAIGSYRSEALRKVVMRVGRALESIAVARSLSEIADTRSAIASPIEDLEDAALALSSLTSSARRRVFGQPPESALASQPELGSLSGLVERAATGGAAPSPAQLATGVRELTAELPHALSVRVHAVLRRLITLPAHVESDAFAIPLERRRASLPDWLLPRRTIGAFYVVRALGTGGVSSVFMARRIEERHDAAAEAFALKVPQFDPAMARRLTEQQFMQMFRDEASALLSLPQHDNLARFVTFDLAARPKPILVMELIRGASLERIVRSRSLSMPAALRYLDGILAGLEAMHAVGVGHHDLKPSNVILRDGETPVLVDFGLSGRHVRPGCGTLEYCAPEILDFASFEGTLRPMATDLYAFACLAFELLSSELLFDAEDDTKLMALHLGHEGWPAKLTALAEQPGCSELAALLADCLQREPGTRPSASDARARLQALAAALGSMPWPLGKHDARVELSA